MARGREPEELNEHRIFRLLRQIIRNQEKIMADLSKLEAVTAKLSNDVDALIAAGASAGQPAVDNATAALQAVDDKVTAATTALTS